MSFPILSTMLCEASSLRSPMLSPDSYRAPGDWMMLLLRNYIFHTSSYNNSQQLSIN
jgi:hypothetical protein